MAADDVFVCLYVECSLSLPLFSHQPLTHVRRMMDVVPAHICVSSITTTLRPAPVHTSWSLRLTNSPALVSENTCLIPHSISFLEKNRCNSRHVAGLPFMIHFTVRIQNKRSAESQIVLFSPVLKRFLLYVRRSEIRGVDVDNPYMNVMTALTVPDIDDVSVVDYDAQEERIYWADVKTQTIKRAFINGTHLETIISSGGTITAAHLLHLSLSQTPFQH